LLERLAAFGIYAKIQNEITATLATFDKDTPKEGDPTDFAVYAHVLAFVQVLEKPTTQTSLQEMKQMLAEFSEK
jgi:hypothetical protein